MTTPNRFYAGDTLDYPITVGDFPPVDGWTLKQRFVPRFATPVQAPVVLTAVVDGTDFRIQVGATTTATYAPGLYGWHTWVELAGERVTLEGTQFQGETTVLPDPSTLAQGADTRSSARKALEDAIALRQASAAAGGRFNVTEYRIGERLMKFGSPADLDALIVRLRVEVSREVRAEEISKGLPDRRKILVRGNRA